MSIFNYKCLLKKGTYRLEKSNSCFRLYDENDNEVYYEDNTGYWAYKEYKHGEQVYFYNSLKENWLKVFSEDKIIYHEKNGKILKLL